MAKSMSKLDIMNTMGDAADKKAKMSSKDPDDDGDSYSDAGQTTMGNKIQAMSGEDRPQKQKAAIAMSEARKKGQKVPPLKK